MDSSLAPSLAASVGEVGEMRTPPPAGLRLGHQRRSTARADATACLATRHLAWGPGATVSQPERDPKTRASGRAGERIAQGERVCEGVPRAFTCGVGGQSSVVGKGVAGGVD